MILYHMKKWNIHRTQQAKLLHYVKLTTSHESLSASENCLFLSHHQFDGNSFKDGSHMLHDMLDEECKRRSEEKNTCVELCVLYRFKTLFV